MTDMETSTIPEAATPGEAVYQEQTRRFSALIASDIDLAAREYGFSLVHSIDPADAMHYMQVLGFEPKGWEERFEVAVFSQKQGKLDEARNAYEDLLSERKERKEIHYNLAVLEQAAGSTDRARLHLETFQSWLETLSKDSVIVNEWRELARVFAETIGG